MKRSHSRNSAGNESGGDYRGKKGERKIYRPPTSVLGGVLCGLAGNACWSGGWDKATSGERDVAEGVCEMDMQCGQGGRKSSVGIQMERLHETGEWF